jgi:hypothetical protein
VFSCRGKPEQPTNVRLVFDENCSTRGRRTRHVLAVSTPLAAGSASLASAERLGKVLQNFARAHEPCRLGPLDVSIIRLDVRRELDVPTSG